MKYYYCDHVKVNEMGEACITQGVDQNFIKYLAVKLKGKKSLACTGCRYESNIKKHCRAEWGSRRGECRNAGTFQRPQPSPLIFASHRT
jgi:hypothetical protein